MISFFMDLITQFETKLKMIGWEKVFSSREIMEICWYTKWERFYGAIGRALEEIDEMTKQENFFFVVDSATWGRPKEDVLLTLWGCYLVLKKCDERKENIQILLAYLEELLSPPLQDKTHKDSFRFDQIFIWLLSLFLVFTFWYYLMNFSEYAYSSKKNHILKDAVTKKDIQVQKKLQDDVLLAYDQKIFSAEELLGETIQKPTILSFRDTLKTYIQTLPQNLGMKSLPVSDFIDVALGYNKRSEFSKKLLWEDLIIAYFVFWNSEAYRESCSLLSPKYCLSSSKSNLAQFSAFWTKTLGWYENLSVKKVSQEWDKTMYCVSYNYRLKNDTSNEFLYEVFNYTTQTTGGYEQIVGRYCEKIQKWSKNIACPFQLKQYYCK